VSKPTEMPQGVLDPLGLKPEQGGWIGAEWRTGERGRRAKCYSLTRPGRGQLEKQAADGERPWSAITPVVRLEEAATCAA
jgi:PadR family transcriptional regulator PadR